ncbi:DUF4349 domain-containing protein [Pseudoduganella sp. GCM10020061]|uniref:DUF4349 domain-containing protein n=1 Tax=Pseudoduganella sp. GCM10020061 TaxID=3317345 RepID=UPI003625AB7C
MITRTLQHAPRVRAALLLAALALAGCSDGDPSPSVVMGETADTSGPRTLAIEHTVTIDVPEPEVRKVHDQTLATCNAQPKGVCAVISANVSTGDEVSAELRLRASPPVVRVLMANLDRQGELVSVGTEATDLAQPIADADRNAAMLAAYRAKLEELAGRAGNDADALIKVHRELAEVQSKIEAAAGQREHLRKQVELEILNVSITAERHTPFVKPIAAALRDFGTHLAQGIAGAVTGFAVLAPSVLVIMLLAWGVRRWRRRRKARPG